MKKAYAGVDRFRLAAAFLVIGIHIGPFSVWSREADYLLTCCAGRIAVPFFLVTTGYFVLAPYVKSGFRKKQAVRRYLAKNGILYLAATLFYTPLALYSGNVPHSAPDAVRTLLFDGTFYHLWYFPAAMTGVIILAILLRVLCRLRGSVQAAIRAAALFSLAAYTVGLFGDSYYGLAERIPLLCRIYSRIFSVSSYTRNGIFYAPVFLLLGVLINLRDETETCRESGCGGYGGCRGHSRGDRDGGGRPDRNERPLSGNRNEQPLSGNRNERPLSGNRNEQPLSGNRNGRPLSGNFGPAVGHRRDSAGCAKGLLLSFAAMLAEGYATYSLHLQRHNSMYLFLLPVMYFLFRLLLMMRGEAPGWIRNCSMLLYVLHPAVIAVLHKAAKAAGLEELLIRNTFVQYLTVCAASLAVTYVIRSVVRAGAFCRDENGSENRTKAKRRAERKQNKKQDKSKEMSEAKTEQKTGQKQRESGAKTERKTDKSKEKSGTKTGQKQREKRNENRTKQGEKYRKSRCKREGVTGCTRKAGRGSSSI